MRAIVVTILVALIAGVGSASPPTDFTFVVQDACDLSEVAEGNKIALTRKGDLLVARIAVLVNCATHVASPRVDFLDDQVNLDIDYVDPKDGSVTSCFCGEVLTFTLLRSVKKGTRIVFGPSEKYPLKAIAP